MRASYWFLMANQARYCARSAGKPMHYTFITATLDFMERLGMAVPKPLWRIDPSKVTEVFDPFEWEESEEGQMALSLNADFKLDYEEMSLKFGDEVSFNSDGDPANVMDPRHFNILRTQFGFQIHESEKILRVTIKSVADCDKAIARIRLMGGGPVEMGCEDRIGGRQFIALDSEHWSVNPGLMQDRYTGNDLEKPYDEVESLYKTKGYRFMNHDLRCAMVQVPFRVEKCGPFIRLIQITLMNGVTFVFDMLAIAYDMQKVMGIIHYPFDPWNRTSYQEAKVGVAGVRHHVELKRLMKQMPDSLLNFMTDPLHIFLGWDMAA